MAKNRLGNTLALASRGLRILPVRPRSKVASLNGWPTAATTDEVIISEWFARDPDTNIGIATGKGSNLVVIDIDGSTGDINLDVLQGRLGGLPDTVSVSTPRGGRHLYFRYPSGFEIGISAGKLAEKIDIRGGGGYVVAPPSVGENGKGYMFIDDEEHFGIAELPEAWARELSSPTKNGRANGTVPTNGRIPEGARDDTIFRLISSMRGRNVPQAAIEVAVIETNKRLCDPPFEEDYIRRKVADACKRYPSGNNGQEGRSKYRKHLVTECLDGIEETPLDMFWPGRFAKGALNLLGGRGGIGKSYASLSMAATLSLGADWPDGAPGTGEPRRTLFLSCEDAVSCVVKPRLRACGADCGHIHIVDGVKRSADGEPVYFDLLSDLDALEENIVENGIDFFVVDPIAAYMPGINTHCDAEVRSALGPFAKMAERTGVTVLMIAHLNKMQSADWAMRFSGSSAFVNISRMVWGCAFNPDDENQRILHPVKWNVAAKPRQIGFDIDGGGCVQWSREAIDIPGERLLAEPTSSRIDAVEWLTELLAVGPMKEADVKDHADHNGPGWRAVQRVKTRAGVKSTKIGYGKDSYWQWALKG